VTLRRVDVTDKRMTNREARYALAYLRSLASGRTTTEPNVVRWLGEGQEDRAIQLEQEVVALLEARREIEVDWR
jgi:hypothetical protein